MMMWMLEDVWPRKHCKQSVVCLTNGPVSLDHLAGVLKWSRKARSRNGPFRPILPTVVECRTLVQRERSITHF